MRFVVDEVTVGRVFLQALLFSPVSIMTPVFRAGLILLLTGRTNSCVRYNIYVFTQAGRQNLLGRMVMDIS